MEYRVLGHSGLEVSAIGLGCMSLKATREHEGIDLIHRALDLGVNLIDTADIYERGLNEQLVGRALAGHRDRVILATKVGNQWRGDGSGLDWNPSKAHIVASVEESLKRLNTDRIDLYQLHGGTIDDPIDETIAAFDTLKKQGKILHYGISSIRPNVIRTWLERSAITSVMMQYSLADRRPEEDMLDLLLEKGIGVLVRGSLAQGLLVSKAGKDYLGHDAAAMDRAREALSSEGHAGRRPAQTAIRYVLHHPAVSSVVVGVRTIEQLEEAVTVNNSASIGKVEMEHLRSLLPPGSYEQHR